MPDQFRDLDGEDVTLTPDQIARARAVVPADLHPMLGLEEGEQQ